MAKILIMYWVTLYVLKSTEEISNIIKFIALNIFFVFLFSFKQIIFGFSPYELVVHCPPPVRRVYSFMGNASVFSVIMGIGSLDLYLRAIYEKRSSFIFLSILYLIVSSLSLHRMPLFITIIVLIGISFFIIQEIGRFISKRIAGTIFFTGSILIVIYLLFSASFDNRLALIREQLISRTTNFVKQGYTEDSLRTRIEQIPSALSALRQHPFGGGVGYTFLSGDSESYWLSRNVGIYRYVPRLPTGTYDNSFLTVLLETGWIGLGLFVMLTLYIVITNFVRALSHRRKEPDIDRMLLLMFGIASIIVLSSLTGSIFFVQIIGTLLVISLAISQKICSI